MKIVRVPSFAPSVPPVTGASIYSIFLLASRAERNLALEGLIVDKSITIVPSVRLLSAPVGPNRTVSTATSSLTQISKTSHPLAASLGVEHDLAPFSCLLVSANLLRV